MENNKKEIEYHFGEPFNGWYEKNFDQELMSIAFDPKYTAHEINEKYRESLEVYPMATWNGKGINLNDARKEYKNINIEMQKSGHKIMEIVTIGNKEVKEFNKYMNSFCSKLIEKDSCVDPAMNTIAVYIASMIHNDKKCNELYNEYINFYRHKFMKDELVRIIRSLIEAPELDIDNMYLVPERFPMPDENDKRL